MHLVKLSFYFFVQHHNFNESENEQSMGEYSNPGPVVSVQQYTTQFIKDGLRLKLAKQLGANKPETPQQLQQQQQQQQPQQPHQVCK